MERKIGEIFEFRNEWYQVVENPSKGCNICSFMSKSDGCTAESVVGRCGSSRSDRKLVGFKKLEKVGEPIIYMSRTFQRLKSLDTEQCKYCYFGNQVCNPQLCGKQSFLVEIKNKEDMEEKKIQHYDCFFDKEPSKSDLKPFSLEAAKAGKPVCTRDGRKARIICFDRNAAKYHIVALIECKGLPNKEEEIKVYNNAGKYFANGESSHDLMMLPEKKEGWVNLWRHESGIVHPDGNIYSSKEEAVKIIGSRCYNYIDTVKIDWEE